MEREPMGPVRRNQPQPRRRGPVQDPISNGMGLLETGLNPTAVNPETKKRRSSIGVLMLDLRR